MHVKLAGERITLADKETSKGLIEDKQINVGWHSSLRLNIFGTDNFEIQVRARMFDNTWRTLPATDTLTGNDAPIFLISPGFYDFDVAGMQKLIVYIASSNGEVSAKGVLLP